MEKVRLRVRTVLAWDPSSNQEHTAYSVFARNGEVLNYAPGWTLRDAIDTFCEWFHVNRESITLHRPFLPQRIVDDVCR